MNPVGKCSFGVLTKIVFVFSLTTSVAINAQKVEGPLVTLPAFHVVDTRILPALEDWKYAQVPGFEVLSSASNSTSRDVVHDFSRFHRAIDAIWPLVRMNASVDASIVLCSSGKELKEFVPEEIINNADQTLSLSLEDREHAAIVINLSAINADKQDGSKILHSEYVHFIVNRIGPRTPIWLKAGLEATFGSLIYTENRCAIPAQEDFFVEERKAFSKRLNEALLHSQNIAEFIRQDVRYQELLKEARVVTLKELFTADNENLFKDAGGGLDPYLRQSQAFISFCLFSENGKYRDAFTRFAYLSARLPQSDGLFEQCFHVGYDVMMAFFWANTENQSNRGFDIIGKDGKVVKDVNKLEFVLATDAQSSRIRAEAQRMAGRSEDGRYSLIAAYLRGQRDPDLLASLGLAEYASGKEDRALKFLLAAVKSNTRSVRAYTTLVKIELSEYLKKSSHHKLLVDQVAELLRLLFKAKSLVPPIPEVYELIAQVWINSSVDPMVGHLQILNQGLALFPFDTELFCLDAMLYDHIGLKAQAVQILDVGYSVTADQAEKQKLAQLKASLEAKDR